MKNNCVVYYVNDNEKLCRYLENSLFTLSLNNKHIKNIFILTYNYMFVRNFFRKYNHIEIIDVSKDFYEYFPIENDYSGTSIHYSAFLKLLIPIIVLLKKYDNILYLDNDTETSSLLNLVFSYIDNEHFFKCAKLCKNIINEELTNDFFFNICKYNNPFTKYSCKFDLINEYVNTGVILINNALIQNNYQKYCNLLNYVINEFKSNVRYFQLPEEIVINIFFRQYLGLLSNKFNGNPFNNKNIVKHYAEWYKSKLNLKLSIQ